MASQAPLPSARLTAAFAPRQRLTPAGDILKTYGGSSEQASHADRAGKTRI